MAGRSTPRRTPIVNIEMAIAAPVLPAEVTLAAERRAPHRLTDYALEVGRQFSAFYRDCKVVGAADDGDDEDFRLAVSVQAKRVIARSLDLLGVEAPDSM